MCPVLRSATAIKMKSRDQAYRQATIKGSRRLLDQKSNQNQDDFAIGLPVINCPQWCTSRENERQIVFSCILPSSYVFSSLKAQINALRHRTLHVGVSWWA